MRYVEEVDFLVDAEVDHQPRGVAQVRRAQDRQHQVSTARYAVKAQSLAEVFTLTGQAHCRGRIPQATDAYGRVQQQAPCGFQRAVALELQQAVEQVGHVAQVVEEVAHARAQKAWRDIAIAVDHRQEHPLIEAVVEMVDPAVERLQRIIDAQRVHGGALELTLVQARIEFQQFQRLGKPVDIRGQFRVSLAVVGMGEACAEQGGEKQ